MDTIDWYHLGIALTSIFKKSKSDFSRFVIFFEHYVKHRCQKTPVLKETKNGGHWLWQMPMLQEWGRKHYAYVQLQERKYTERNNLFNWNIIHITPTS